MTTNKKVLFISHTAADAKNVDVIYNYLKKVVKIKNKKYNYKIVYSSSDDPDDKLKGKKLAETILQIPKSTACIAYLTEKYLVSKDCLLELGAALGAAELNTDSRTKKGRKPVSILKFLSIKDIKSDKLGTLSELIHRDIDYKLIDEIEASLGITIPKAEKNEFKNVIKEIKNNNNANKDIADITKAVQDIRQFITSTFNNHSKLSDKPVIVYVDRPIYESLSMELAKIGESLVLWTLYRSPLLNKNALKQDSKTTDYELFFSELTSPKKRLIIFETNDEANEYLDKKQILPRKLKDRKNAFNALNTNCLYYTTVRKIKNAYKKHEETKINGKEFFYEFAYLKSNEFNFCVFSEFSSEIHTKDTKVHPLVFIKAAENIAPEFVTDKYINSSLLNKFISCNFESLLTEDTIKRIC